MIFLPFVADSGRSGRNRNMERQVRTLRGIIFAG